MEGFGSHNNWGYYNHLQPPSNLSASATPFSVPTPNPIHFPDHSQSYGCYDFFSDPVTKLDSPTPSSNPVMFGYPGSQVSPFPLLDQCSHTIKTSPFQSQSYVPPYEFNQCSNATKTNHFESKPYVPPYVPYSHAPVIHDQNSSSSVVPNHWSPVSGFTSLDGRSLHDDYADKDKTPGLGFPAGGLTASQLGEFHMGKGKCLGVGSSSSSNQTNINNSVAEERIKRGYQGIKDNHGRVPHMIDLEKHSVPTSADQFDDKSCWWATVRPAPVDFPGASVLQPSSFSVETHEAPLVVAVDSGNHHVSYTGVHNKDLRQQDKPSGVDMAFSTPMTGSVTDLNIGNTIADGNVGHHYFYDKKEAYLSMSPGIGSCFYSENLHRHLERSESSSNNSMISDMDSMDYSFKARHGFQNPNPTLDSLSLRLNATEDVNSIEKSFSCGNLCNPAVDSPCWKGVPTASFFHYESSEALPSEHVRKNEECFGSVIQEAHNFLPARESNAKMSYYRSNSERGHIGTVDQETSSAGSLRKFLETKLASENFKSDGAVNAGHSQSESSSDDGLQYLDTGVKETSVPPTKPIDCESGSSDNEDQVIKENKLVSQKSHTLWTGGAKAVWNENNYLESGKSFKQALTSPLADAPTAPEKSIGKLNVQMLVDKMQNLSEVLLNHCLNDGCELEERDSDILRNVITNLNTCALKNAEQITLAPKNLLHQLETSRCAEELRELQQNVHFKRAQITRTEPEDFKVTFVPNPCFDFIPPRDDAEMTKTEKMTKALKKILGENFDDDESTESQSELYKNLWLESEAALCSVNYKARYNQMKIEMGKHSYKQRDMEEQSKDEAIPSLSESQSSATKVHNNPNSDSSAKELPILDATKPGNPKAGFKFSTDLNKPSLLTPEREGRQDLDSFAQKYTVSGTNKEAAGNDEASMMARYHVLIARHNPNDLEKPSDTIALEKPSQESPIPEKDNAAYRASVLARFHILKSRVEDSSSISSEEKWLDGVGSSGKGKEDTIITENVSEGESLDAYLNSYTAVDNSIPKEIHLDMEKIFDWEHV